MRLIWCRCSPQVKVRAPGAGGTSTPSSHSKRRGRAWRADAGPHLKPARIRRRQGTPSKTFSPGAHRAANFRLRRPPLNLGVSIYDPTPCMLNPRPTRSLTTSSSVLPRRRLQLTFHLVKENSVSHQVLGRAKLLLWFGPRPWLVCTCTTAPSLSCPPISCGVELLTLHSPAYPLRFFPQIAIVASKVRRTISSQLRTLHSFLGEISRLDDSIPLDDIPRVTPPVRLYCFEPIPKR